MTDPVPSKDLSSRLRDESRKFYDDDNCGLLLLEEAADEIERLQHDLSKALANHSADLSQVSSHDLLIDRWSERWCDMQRCGVTTQHIEASQLFAEMSVAFRSLSRQVDALAVHSAKWVTRAQQLQTKLGAVQAECIERFDQARYFAELSSTNAVPEPLTAPKGMDVYDELEWWQQKAQRLHRDLARVTGEREVPHCSTCECWKADTQSEPPASIRELVQSAYKDGYGEDLTDDRDLSERTRELMQRLQSARRFKVGDDVPIAHYGETSKIVAVCYRLANGEIVDDASGAAPEPTGNPFDKARAVFAGKKSDAYLLKMWFETQEDLDAAFDVIDGTAQPPGAGQS